MRNARARFLGLALLAVTSLLTACGIAVPTERSGYVGKWRGDTISLRIRHNGAVDYERTQGALTKSVSAPIQEFVGDDFVVGIIGFTTTFKVQAPPMEVDGIWTMVVDGEQLVKDVPGTQETLESLGKSAADGAKQFVELLDAQDYVASWHQLNGEARQRTPLDEWTAYLAQWRAPYGPKAERQLRGSSYTQTVEEGPIAHYFSFLTETSFAGGERAQERVRITRVKDGSWRVTKYEISRVESSQDSPGETDTVAGLSFSEQTADPVSPEDATWDTGQAPQMESRVEYVETPLDGLAAYVDQPVRIHTSDGVDHTGYLLSTARSRVTIRSRLSNGTADFEIMHHRIEKAEVMREVAY